MFTARAAMSAVLAVVILSVSQSVSLCVCPSVRPSVRPSHACFVTKSNIALRIFDTTRKGNRSSFLTLTVVNVPGRRPLPSEICAQSDPPSSKTPTSTDFRL